VSTDKLKLKGVSYPDFPLLTWSYTNVNLGISSGDPFFEGIKFLLYYCVKRGRAKSKKTLSTYASHLSHFFSFCEDNQINWRCIVENSEDEMLLSVYRDVSMNDFKLSQNTVNQRLRTLIQFYKYAQYKGWIESLPYGLESVNNSRGKHGFLAHADRGGNQQVSYDVLMKQQPSQIKFYTIDEVKQIVTAIKNTTLKLMVRVLFQTGIRRKELLRFPLDVVKRPASNQKTCRVNINRTKGEKHREIDIPAKLMRDLWDYSIELRHQQSERSGVNSQYLFLTTEGEEWSLYGGGFNKALEQVKLQIKISPHKCRHTYATHSLKALQAKKNSKFEPLMYLRDRLGHSSINTTMIYLHLVNELMDDLTTEYQDEIDAIT